jgi:beta-lactamase superfamily II metal-dependent hydrolase
MCFQTYTDVFILNVGAGSCAVIAHPGPRRSMIDINNGGQLRAAERSALVAEGAFGRLAQIKAGLEDPIEWFQERFGRDLWRFILSHPDEDHMSGLRCILAERRLEASFFWDLQHTKPHAGRDDFLTEEAYLDWACYQAMRNGQQIEGVTWPTVIHPTRFDEADYWAQDRIEILSPSPQFLADRNKVGDWNNMSYVLRVSHHGRSVILPGDVEQQGWDDLASACEARGADLSCDVLVASHHGRKSGYPGNGVLERMAPSVVVTSTAKLAPKDDATPLYRAVADHVLSTRDYGTLRVRLSDGGSLDVRPAPSAVAA